MQKCDNMGWLVRGITLCLLRTWLEQSYRCRRPADWREYRYSDPSDLGRTSRRVPHPPILMSPAIHTAILRGLIWSFTLSEYIDCWSTTLFEPRACSNLHRALRTIYRRSSYHAKGKRVRNTATSVQTLHPMTIQKYWTSTLTILSELNCERAQPNLSQVCSDITIQS